MLQGRRGKHMKQSVHKKRPVHKTQVHKKSKILKKSQYYRQQQLRYRIFGVAAILVVVLLILLIRGCSSAKAKSASSDQVQAEEKPTVTSEPAMDPVSLTISVVGDCTLGTDEEFDYDTSLNAYYDNNGPDYFFANVKNIFEADNLTIANFEGTLTDSEDREDKQLHLKRLRLMLIFLLPALLKQSILQITTVMIMETRVLMIL